MQKIVKCVVTVLLVLSLAGCSASTATAATKNMEVHFINVGQGDAILVKTAAGETMLIDAGNRNGSKVVTYLKKQNVKKIDVMIATHPDADHIGGLDEVLNAFPVKAVYAPKVTHTTQAYKDFLLAVKREKLTIKTATKGVKIPLKGANATIIGPVKSYGKTDLNNWSTVVRVVYNKKSFLFAGDAEWKAEQDLLTSKQVLKADVLKVGHHGANTSSSAAFLKAVSPKYAVISVGKNSYGHPSSSLLNRLKAVKATSYRTDVYGNIVFTTNGTTTLNGRVVK